MYLNRKNQLLSYENKKWDEEFFYVIGLDEVGRGPLAGPVIAAGVIFPKQYDKIPLVDDSKKLTAKKRLEIFDILTNDSNIKYAIHKISPKKIDEINILQASQLAMIKALKKLKIADFALIDGLPIKKFPLNNLSIIKGDSKSASIAAASIIAKVYRDNLMIKYAKKYPHYGFETNMGYGTKQHIKALYDYGITPIHRKSFAPVKDIVNPPPEQLLLNLNS